MKINRLRMHEIFEQVAKITDIYKPKNIKLVLGVATGGILPGYLVSEWLNCDYMTIRPNLDIPDSILNNPNAILIVDDILDTGKTKDKIMSQFNGNEVYFETLFKAKKSQWLVFPWESEQDPVNSRQTTYEN